MIRKIFFLTIILFFNTTSINAQHVKYSFDRITKEDGLSQGTVTSIIQDSKGFMWFGTYDGLNRYDGIKFKVFKNDVSDIRSISHNSVTAICEDQFNNLWIGTMSGGLNLYNSEKENFIRFKNNPYDSTSLSHDIVHCIFNDNSGNLWLGTWGGGLNLYNREKSEFIHFKHDLNNPNSIASDQINQIDQDNNGNIWLATSAGVSRFNYETLEFKNFVHNPNDPFSLSSNDISTILVGPKGYIWIGTWGKGINRLDPETEEIKRFLNNPNNPHSLSHNIIRDIFADETGRLFAATWGGGLEIFDYKAEHFDHLKNDPTDQTSLSGDFIYSIYQDKTNIFWVGTDYEGINKFDHKKQKFTHYKKSQDTGDGLNSNIISSIVEDTEGIIWLGTNGGLNRYDPKTQKFRSYVSDPDDPNALSNNVIKSMCMDNGIIWLATELGLNSFDPKTGKFKRYLPDPNDPTSISFHNVWYLLVDSYGVLWVGTFSGGLNKFNRKDESFQHYKHNPDDSSSLGNNYIWSIMEDSEGYIWLGTDNSGINRYDRKSDTFKTYKHNKYNSNSISDNKVLCLLEANNGIIWIGTTNGLNSYDRKKNIFKRYFIKNGLPSNSIQAILEDDEQNLWISTNNGLCKFNPEKENFQNFNESNGLQSNEFAVNSCLKAKNGLMYFGGINGFNVFNPKEIDRNPFIPPVVITDFKIYNKDVPIGTSESNDFVLSKSISETNSISLSYDQNVFSFEFAALSFSYPKNNQYAYMMENFETDWNYVGNRNFITYTDLPAGSYIFKVKASNNDGVWNELGTSLAINITPPVWATWWFRTVALGFIIYLIVAYQRFRTRIFKQQNIALEEAVQKKTVEMGELMGKMIRQEKLAAIGKISGSIAHELRNPLGAVKQSVYFLKLKLSDAPEKVFKHLNLIDSELNVADRVIDDLMEMTRVKSANKEYINLNILIDEAVERVKINENVDIKIEIDANAQQVWADAIQLRQVLVNLITNSNQALESKGNIKIISSLTPNKEFVQISVDDNGTGIKPDFMDKVFEPLYTTKAKGTGLGLNICKQIIEKHGGKINITSKVNEGTSVLVFLPNKENIGVEDQV